MMSADVEAVCGDGVTEASAEAGPAEVLKASKNWAVGVACVVLWLAS